MEAVSSSFAPPALTCYSLPLLSAIHNKARVSHMSMEDIHEGSAVPRGVSSASDDTFAAVRCCGILITFQRDRGTAGAGAGQGRRVKRGMVKPVPGEFTRIAPFDRTATSGAPQPLSKTSFRPAAFADPLLPPTDLQNHRCCRCCTLGPSSLLGDDAGFWRTPVQCSLCPSLGQQHEQRLVLPPGVPGIPGRRPAQPAASIFCATDDARRGAALLPELQHTTSMTSRLGSQGLQGMASGSPPAFTAQPSVNSSRQGLHVYRSASVAVPASSSMKMGGR